MTSLSLPCHLAIHQGALNPSVPLVLVMGPGGGGCWGGLPSWLPGRRHGTAEGLHTLPGCRAVHLLSFPDAAWSAEEEEVPSGPLRASLTFLHCCARALGRKGPHSSPRLNAFKRIPAPPLTKPPTSPERTCQVDPIQTALLSVPQMKSCTALSPPSLGRLEKGSRLDCFY